MGNVQPFRERACYLCVQNVLKHSAKPAETSRPHKVQVEIGSETIPYVRIDGMNRRPFHRCC